MVFEKTLAEIVDENFIYARALHYLGISFFENQNKSLGEICRERRLDQHRVIRVFYDFDGCNRPSFNELNTYPIDMLLEYLKHAHHLFIKEKLPFITYIAKNCDEAPELQVLLPEFVEDFIRHIYEEEDAVFKYVKALDTIKKGKVTNPMSKLIPYHTFSLTHEFEHHREEDEMKAIRTLVDSVKPQSLKEHILIKEVKAFDGEMLYHAEIENEIFFPKTIELEQEVYANMKRISALN